MRAWVLEDYGRLALVERPLPEGEGLLLRVLAAGVCGSDLSVYKGTPAMRSRWQPPLILGHEVAAVVEEGPKELLGQAVALYPALSCGSCPACLKGRPHLCPQRRHLGFHYPGGLAQWIRVPEELAHPLPEGLPPWKGALAEPLAVALHGVRRSPREGKALVLGGGAMGSLAAWLLAQEGRQVHVLEPNPRRANHLAGLGFSLWKEGVRERFPLVLDTVGQGETLRLALEAAEPGGQVVVLGLGGVDGFLDLQSLVLQEKAVLGSYLFTPEEFQEAIGLLAELPEGLVRRWPASRAPEAFQALLEGRVPEPKLVLVW